MIDKDAAWPSCREVLEKVEFVYQCGAWESSVQSSAIFLFHHFYRVSFIQSCRYVACAEWRVRHINSFHNLNFVILNFVALWMRSRKKILIPKLEFWYYLRLKVNYQFSSLKKVFESNYLSICHQNSLSTWHIVNSVYRDILLSWLSFLVKGRWVPKVRYF